MMRWALHTLGVILSLFSCFCLHRSETCIIYQSLSLNIIGIWAKRIQCKVHRQTRHTWRHVSDFSCLSVDFDSQHNNPLETCFSNFGTEFSHQTLHGIIYNHVLLMFSVLFFFFSKQPTPPSAPFWIRITKAMIYSRSFCTSPLCCLSPGKKKWCNSLIWTSVPVWRQCCPDKMLASAPRRGFMVGGDKENSRSRGGCCRNKRMGRTAASLRPRQKHRNTSCWEPARLYALNTVRTALQIVVCKEMKPLLFMEFVFVCQSDIWQRCGNVSQHPVP